MSNINIYLSFPMLKKNDVFILKGNNIVLQPFIKVPGDFWHLILCLRLSVKEPLLKQ